MSSSENKSKRRTAPKVVIIDSSVDADANQSATESTAQQSAAVTPAVVEVPNLVEVPESPAVPKSPTIAPAAEVPATAPVAPVAPIEPVEPVAGIEPIAAVEPIAEVPTVQDITPVPVVAPVASAKDTAPVAKPKPEIKTQDSEIPASDIPEGELPSKKKLLAETTEAKEEREKARVKFDDLPLAENVLKSVKAAGYEHPTAIQEKIIPHMIDGRDVLAQSQTGSGKTAAFALPILSKIDTSAKKPTPSVLVLAPTRELAIQVARAFETYASQIPKFQVAAIYGGQDYEIQFRKIRKGIHVVVGTPGRVIDHMNRGTLDLSQVTTLVLDEADEMLNMGFLDDVKFVLDRIADERQITLFSATFNNEIQKIAKRYLKDPVKVKIQRKNVTADSIRQRAMLVANRDKMDLLVQMLEVESTDGVLIFTRTRESTVFVADALNRAGLSVAALNGDMPQRTRERTITRLKSGNLDIVVATDVAARGLDVTRISHVFNYDFPENSESYVHRIGRTGRAGQKGEAILFLNHSQRGKLRMVERATGKAIEVVDRPSAKSLNKMRVEKLCTSISTAIAKEDLARFQKLLNDHATETGESMLSIAAALAHLGQGGAEFFSTDKPKQRISERDRNRSDRSDRFDRSDRKRGRERRGSESPDEGMVRYRIEVGRRHSVKPGNIVGAISNEAGIEGKHIGAIQIYDNHSTVDLPDGMPSDVHDILENTRVVGQLLQIRKATKSDEVEERGGFRGRSNSRGRGFSGGGKRDFRKGGKPGGKRKFSKDKGFKKRK